MTKFFTTCLTSLALISFAPSFAQAHCSCDQKCADKCMSGKDKDCSCSSCSKDGGCDPKSCSHHHGKHSEHHGNDHSKTKGDVKTGSKKDSTEKAAEPAPSPKAESH